MGMTLTSLAFGQNGPIPKRYTCEGDDVSPPLTWTGVPAGAASLLLICDDPDAPRGVFTHWVAFNIPPDLDGLPEGAGAREKGVFQQATNDFGGVGYGGPCPPRGDRPHRYRFRLMAIDHLLDGVPTAARHAQIMEKAKPSVIALAELVGHYGRQSLR